MKNNLRKGYTTGSCCAAAAGSAMLELLDGETLSEYEIIGPTGAHILVPISNIKIINERSATAVVIKDGGDDPDITTGAEVVATISLVKEFTDIVCNIKEDKGYFLDERVYLQVGEGIGIVTKPGLACPEGKSAVNPVPRKMILKEVIKQAESCCYEGKVLVEISIPKGRKIAENTYNPKLGIVGGISVLGTTGIVEPMSSQAILETVKVELSVARALNKSSSVIITPGNYGVDFLENSDFVRDFPEENIIKVSNFIGESTVLAVQSGFRHLIVSGHLGKMIKVAGGMLNTHSKYGDNRVETAILILEEIAGESNDKNINSHGEKFSWINEKDQLIDDIKDAVMVDEILRLIKDYGGDHLLRDFSKRVCKKVSGVLNDNLVKENEKYDKIRMDIIVFTNKFGLLYCDEIGRQLT